MTARGTALEAWQGVLVRGICAVILSGLLGCATKIPVKVTHPAEINMEPYKQIAIGEIGGNLGHSFSDDLKNRLVQSERFKVVDRTTLDQIVKEINLSQSDLSSTESRVKLGKLLAASALITGRVGGDYDEKRTYEDKKCRNYKTKTEYPCRYQYREGIYKTNGSIQVIDVETGQILRSKPMDAAKKSTTKAIDEEPASIDSDALAAFALNMNVNNFLKAITPWTETVMVAFETDGTVPELQNGINQAKLGEMKEAASIFKSCVAVAEGNAKISPSTRAKLYWNLGLAYEYSHQFNEATDAIKKAFSYSPKDMYRLELENVKRLEAEKRKLDQQVGG